MKVLKNDFIKLFYLISSLKVPWGICFSPIGREHQDGDLTKDQWNANKNLRKNTILN